MSETDSDGEVVFSHWRQMETSKRRRQLKASQKDEISEMKVSSRRRKRKTDSSDEEEVLDTDTLPERERQKFFWVMIIRYIAVFVVFVFLHQLITRSWIDPWRGAVSERKLAERLKEQLCPPGKPCELDLDAL